MSESHAATILTVEDEVLIAEFLGDVLREAGYQVVAAANADAAIALLESRNDIRVVITDVNMPGSMDGLRLAGAISGRWPPVKIIVTTGWRRPASDQLPNGTLFLSKPYDPKAVIVAVKSLL